MNQLINKDYMLHLDLYVKDCAAEFYFNDIPVRKMEATENFHSLNAHHLVLDGSNQMEIVVNPGPTPSVAKKVSTESTNEKPDGDPKACMRLVKYPVGAYAGDTVTGKAVMQLNWELAKLELTSFAYPMFTSTKVDLGKMLGPWFWQQCSPVNFEQELPRIHQAVEALYTAFISGDAQTVVRMSEAALRDIGKALPAYGEQGFREDMLADIQTNKVLTEKALPYDAELTDFRLCANGRLVQLINKDWSHTIKMPEDEEGEVYELPAFIGKLRDQWFVVM